MSRLDDCEKQLIEAHEWDQKMRDERDGINADHVRLLVEWANLGEMVKAQLATIARQQADLDAAREALEDGLVWAKELQNWHELMAKGIAEKYERRGQLPPIPMHLAHCNSLVEDLETALERLAQEVRDG